MLPKEVLATSDTLLVGYDMLHGEDKAILIVARKLGEQKDGGYIDIVNAFEGEKAIEIFKILTTKANMEEKQE